MRVNLQRDPTPGERLALEWLGYVEDCADRWLRIHRVNTKRNKSRIAADIRSRLQECVVNQQATVEPDKTKE